MLTPKTSYLLHESWLYMSISYASRVVVNFVFEYKQLVTMATMVGLG